MFKPIPGGSVEVITVDFWGQKIEYRCHIPPVGYGINVATGELEKTDILQRSKKKSEQKFERIPLPVWWDVKRTEEKKRQKSDRDYVDQDCEKFRREEWGRRLRGVWFYNNGVPVYITGAHWFLLNCWKFQTKWLSYRNPNRKFFYVWRLCEEDPNSLGLIEVTKRKEGKTARMGCIIYERTSRQKGKHAGIQSKTDDDAGEVFAKAVVQPWQSLPDFYRPVWDKSQGTVPQEKLRFFKTSVRGSKADDQDEFDEELQSWIDFKNRKVPAYDGPELDTYGSDEAGKLVDISIWERHDTVRYCSEVDGDFIGKQIYTTTVEDMEAGGGEFLRLVKDSNPMERDENGRTRSGLYIYMLPAYETMFYDDYGNPDIARGMKYFMNIRASKQGDEKALMSHIRKNPFNLAEAFKIDGDKCHYNAYKLNERDSYLSWNTPTKFGNFFWKGGMKDTTVEWEENPDGRWEISWLPPEEFRNRVERNGGLHHPRNIHKFISGCDTYDHDSTEDNRNSMAASFVKRRVNPAGDDAVSRKYVCKYHHRPPMADMVYEDLIMQSVFFGCGILCESNKPGVLNYFRRRGYEAFLIHIPGYKEPGIPSTADNKREASLMMEAYIEQNINKMDFREWISQLLRFDIKKTGPYDLAMASLWTEYADNYRYFESDPETEEVMEMDQLFQSYRYSPAFSNDEKILR